MNPETTPPTPLVSRRRPPRARSQARHGRRRFAVAALAITLLAGCASNATASTTTPAAPTSSPSSSTSTSTPAAPTTTAAPTTSAPAAFPVTVTGANGRVTIAARPQRIVSLSASLTEMLYAAGAGEQVVAVDKYSNYPAGTPLTDLSGFKPNVESIAALTPDLVVVSGDRDGVVAALDAVGITTLVLPSAKSVDDALDQLATIGAATGHADAATAAAASIRTRLATIADRAPERRAPLPYYLELADDGRTVTSATFIGNVLALAGLASIADTAGAAAGGYPQLSSEAVLAADPAVIFLAYSNGKNPSAADLAARPGWNELQAVRNGNVVVLDPDVASRWGPRLVDLLTAAVDGTATIT